MIRCDWGNGLRGEKRERVKGIEPSYAAWEAAVLPLNYTRTTDDIVKDRVRWFQGKINNP